MSEKNLLVRRRNLLRGDSIVERFRCRQICNWTGAVKNFLLGHFGRNFGEIYEFLCVLPKCIGTPLLQIYVDYLYRRGLIPDRRWPSWLISSSFAVFATHQLIIKLTEFGLKQVGFDIIAYAGNSGVWWIIMTFVYTTVGVAFALFLRNFFPRLAIVLFGGR